MVLKSYVPYKSYCDFPIENLPYGVFSTREDTVHRIGVAIGDLILDLKNTKNVFNDRNVINAFQKETLNEFMAMGNNVWRNVRRSLQDYLLEENKQNFETGVFVKQTDATMHLPVAIGNYTDFFSSYHHATNCCRIMNRELPSSWKHMPIAYHGRSSTVCVSGTPVKRPWGNIIRPGLQEPVYAPTEKLDYELEVAFFVGGSLNKMGETLKIDNVDEFIFGMVLLNDWSARDIQLYESAPLGPFLSKSFATSISPWIVTMEALNPFLVPNNIHSPIPSDYLVHEDNYNFNILLEAYVKRNGTVTKVCTTNFRYLYWTSKQHLCHQASNGCAVKIGDLLSSGTVSGPEDTAMGCLFELTKNGKTTAILDNKEGLLFLNDGDEVILKGYAKGDNYLIGFGSCVGKVLQ